METDYIVVDEKYYEERCYKALNRGIQIRAAIEKMKYLLITADELDKWNGFGEGYVSVREGIQEISDFLKEAI